MSNMFGNMKHGKFALYGYLFLALAFYNRISLIITFKRYRYVFSKSDRCRNVNQVIKFVHVT